MQTNIEQSGTSLYPTPFISHPFDTLFNIFDLSNEMTYITNDLHNTLYRVYSFDCRPLPIAFP